jgi:hypothetical protein
LLYVVLLLLYDSGYKDKSFFLINKQIERILNQGKTGNERSPAAAYPIPGGDKQRRTLLQEGVSILILQKRNE